MAFESSSNTCREPKRTNKTSQSPLWTEDPQPLPNLPCEIIVEILSRLPVKSLLRLRCVFKSWRSLISNRKFAKTHVSLASMNTDYSNHRLILSSLNPPSDVKSCSLYSILNEKSDSAVQLDCPLKAPDLQVKIWGCCDGLVCIGTEREVLIWNPSTGKYKGLPNVEMWYCCYGKFAEYAFGYDECIDDYKVVGFFFDNHTSGSNPIVTVCTLRSDSWRRIGDFPRGVPEDPSWAFVNRALHWVHSSSIGKSNDIIVSPDLGKETYGEVSEPEYRDGYFYEISLRVLNGCLSILCNYYDVCFDVWVTKEYGIRDSWTMLVVIPYVVHPPPSDCPYSTPLCVLEDGEVLPDMDCPYSTPLCVLENSEVLLDMVTQLVRFNPKDGTFSYPLIYNCSARLRAYPYIESLVSPDYVADSGFLWQNQY
ncbi:hypothetical protein RHMOL_Rhmol05G0233800 [Rhododendron molle]|uniref:Uncharacterized protein n=1 Tax=Rhododendron molle TaxID=49168 RepID=A0ACC0NT95_RHOML|nr:hypothetical protein RHMOL_Rhmol05G0233800 [Rhododendron molle]